MIFQVLPLFFIGIYGSLKFQNIHYGVALTAIELALICFIMIILNILEKPFITE